MKLILSVDAIVPPLTGIGRYAFELASRLAQHPNIELVRFYSNRRWVHDLLERGALPLAPVSPRSLLRRVPSFVFRKTVPLILRRKLDDVAERLAERQLLWMHRDHVYHSPNYFLPPVSGYGVATIHDLSTIKYPHTHPPERLKQFEKNLSNTLRRASYLITDSQAIRQEVIEHFSWPPEKIFSVPLGVAPCYKPGVDAGTLSILRQYELKAGEYALCVSTLEPRKNIDLLLRAYQQLPHNLVQRYPLILAGSKGWLSESLMDAITDGQRAGWVRYLGYVPERDLPAIFAGTRAFLFPSSYEGFGLPVLEAMASGVPVLTSDRSCLPEVSGGAALLVNPEDMDALRLGIEKVLVDDSWRDQARAHGLVVATNATWDRCVSRTVDVYKLCAA